MFEAPAEPAPESSGAGANTPQVGLKGKSEDDIQVLSPEVAEPVKKASRSPSKKRKSGHGHGHGHSHGEGSMNMRGVVLHVFGDALASLGVVVSGLIIWLTPLNWRFYFDPLLSMIIVIIILFSAVPLGKPPQPRQPQTHLTTILQFDPQPSSSCKVYLPLSPSPESAQTSRPSRVSFPCTICTSGNSPRQRRLPQCILWSPRLTLTWTLDEE